MAKIVQVPGLGNVEFPDSMADEDIGKALANQVAPPPGMGDLKAADEKAMPAAIERERVLSGALNVPVGWKTGDPATDRKIAENLWGQGMQRALTRSDALHGGAIAGGLMLGMAGGLPAAVAGNAMVGGGLTPNDNPVEIGKNAGLAAATAYGAGKFLPKAVDAISQRAAPWLGEKATALARRVLTGGKTPLSVKQPVSQEAVDAAFQSGAIRPLGSTSGTAERLKEARGLAGQEYADTLAALEKAGVKGPKALDLARELHAEANQSANVTLGSPKPGIFRSVADELLTKQTGPNQVGGELGLTQAESMKRALQHEAATEYDKLLNKMRPTGEAKVAIASRVRQAIEDAVEAQAAQSPQEAAAFVPAKQKLGALIEASNAANEGAARAAYRSHFGLPELQGMVAGAAAHGTPGGALGLVGTKLIRGRGPSTGAYLLHTLEELAKNAPGGATGPSTPLLANAVRLKLGAPALRLVPVAAEERTRDEGP
ncbi:MAG TPA: hypothetical protein VF777_01430 [Phycisphaerales bacterium]